MYIEIMLICRIYIYMMYMQYRTVRTYTYVCLIIRQRLGISAQHKITLCNSDKDGNAGLGAWHRVEPASSMFHVNYTSNMRTFLYTASINISPSVLCYFILIHLNLYIHWMLWLCVCVQDEHALIVEHIFSILDN